jgi:hypothetical protein
MSASHATAALDRLLESVGRSWPLEFARDLAELRAAPDVQARIETLAERCNEGELTAEERAEYEGYVQAIHLIGVLQAKARAVLSQHLAS